MTAPGRDRQERLGGRLPLLAPAELSDAQHELYATGSPLQSVILTVVAGRRSADTGYAHSRAARRAGVATEVVDAILVALVSLVGQYLTTCALLSCFDVPAPDTT